MSSTSSKSSKKLKKIKSTVVAEEKPTSSFFSYYFCCFCILPKRSRKLKRKLEKERLERPSSVETDNDEEGSEDDSVEPNASKKNAVIKIQSLVRGVQTRALMQEYWKEALEEANAHWLKIVRARELAWLIEERKLVARKQVCRFVTGKYRMVVAYFSSSFTFLQFVLQYVEDIVATSMSFFVQTSNASTEIQRCETINTLF